MIGQREPTRLISNRSRALLGSDLHMMRSCKLRKGWGKLFTNKDATASTANLLKQNNIATTSKPWNKMKWEEGKMVQLGSHKP